MRIFLMILGAILIISGIFIRREKLQKWKDQPLEKAKELPSETGTRLLEQNKKLFTDFMYNVNERMLLLEEALYEINEVLVSQNNKFGRLESLLQNQKFSPLLEEKSVQELQKEIMSAYRSGMDIEEIAKKYQRGKGEIQLILSLQSLKEKS